MLKLMKKIPAGTILIPMFLAAIFNTFAPNLFNIGGFTEWIFSSKALSFILGITCFASGICIDIKIIPKIIKKQGLLCLIKILLSTLFTYLFVLFFGADGIFGISSLAIVVALTSINPSIYIAIVDEFGEKNDVLAFGIVALFAIPAIPLFIYGLTSTSTNIDWMPIISTLIPLLLGVIWGNLDKDAKPFFSPIISSLMPFLGWAIGININLGEALKSGFSGILLTIIFIVLMLPIMIFIERYLLKSSGISTIGMNTVSGLSISIPTFMAANLPQAIPYVDSSVAQMTTAMILTSILAPILSKYIHKKAAK